MHLICRFRKAEYFSLQVLTRFRQTEVICYIPQGYGHSIENTGSTRARILIGFNSGIYESIDLTQWIAGNPADVLATNFDQTTELVKKFPHRDVFVAGKNGPGK